MGQPLPYPPQFLKRSFSCSQLILDLPGEALAEIPAVGEALVRVIQEAAVIGAKQTAARKAQIKKQAEIVAAKWVKGRRGGQIWTKACEHGPRFAREHPAVSIRSFCPILSHWFPLITSMHSLTRALSEAATTPEEKAKAAEREAAAKALPDSQAIDDATAVDELAAIAVAAGCPAVALDKLCCRNNLTRLVKGGVAARKQLDDAAKLSALMARPLEPGTDYRTPYISTNKTNLPLW